MSEPALATHDYLRFQSLMQERSGLHFPEKRRQDLASGVLRGMAESGYRNLDEYYRVLSETGSPAGRAAFEQLVNLLTVGETHFFRDEAQFNALERHILPALVTRRAGQARRLRLWSAGCASGEEAYSLAMLLTSALPDPDTWEVTLLATDISSAALRRAREGVYGEWSFREERARAAQRMFFSVLPGSAPSGGPRYWVRQDVRARVSFASLNLVEDAYPALYNNTMAMDLIVCRNVLIYFQAETIRRVLAQLSDCLVTGGWLVLGHADPSPGREQAQLQARTLDGAVVYQKVASTQPAAWGGWAAPADMAAVSPTPAERVAPAAPSAGAWPFAPAEPAVAAHRAATESADAGEPLAQALELLENGRAPEAIARLEAYLERRPNDASAVGRLGEAYANLARWNHARAACEQAITLDPLQLHARFVLGMVQEHTGELDPALESFKQVVYLDREHVLAHMALASLYQRTGRGDPARRSLRNAIRLLEARPAGEILPGSGGSTVGRLLVVAREMAKSWQE